MKDSLTALLVFALAFCGFFIFFTLLFIAYLAVVPGGTGLVFSNPYSMALYPSLGLGMLLALNRVSKKPGKTLFTLGALVLGMSGLLYLGVPATAWLPSPLSPDRIPFKSQQVQDLRFPSEDAKVRQVFWYNESSLGQFLSNIYVWSKSRDDALEKKATAEDEPSVFYSPTGQYDALNQRILLSGKGGPIDLKGNTAESEYFGEQGPFSDVVKEMKVTYDALAHLWSTAPGQAWVWCLLLCSTWVGLFFLYSLKDWPLLKWMFVLVIGRMLFWLYPFSVKEGPDILASSFLASWAPIFPYYFYILIAVSFFSLVLVLKPQKKEEWHA